MAITILVLVTLVSAFPQVARLADTASEVRSENMQDHMTFTRELAEQGTRLDTLRAQHDAMSGLPERMARMETKLELLVVMIYAILMGVGGLLFKEVWGFLKARRPRRANGVED